MKSSIKVKKYNEDKRKDLDKLIDFVNTDLTKEENRRKQSFFVNRLWKHPALHIANSKTVSDRDPNLIMDALQRHVRSRLRKIVKNKKLIKTVLLLEISGSVSLELTPFTNSFHEQFKLRKVKPGNEVKALKKIIDLWLLEIIRDLKLKPRQIGRCNLCSNFYFQSTIREKRFCSEKCSNAVRQQKYREKRRAS